MAQTAARLPFRQRIGWDRYIKPWLVRAIIAAAAFFAALWFVAPWRQAQQPGYLPASFLALPSGVVTVSTLEGSDLLLPVRLVETSAARSEGFAGVGETALDGHFLLYTLSRETSGRASYATEGVRAPLDFAAISGEGEVVAVHRAPAGGQRIGVTEPHQWLLVAGAGSLERYGVAVGSRIDPESVRKF